MLAVVGMPVAPFAVPVTVMFMVPVFVIPVVIPMIVIGHGRE